MWTYLSVEKYGNTRVYPRQIVLPVGCHDNCLLFPNKYYSRLGYILSHLYTRQSTKYTLSTMSTMYTDDPVLCATSETAFVVAVADVYVII